MVVVEFMVVGSPLAGLSVGGGGGVGMDVLALPTVVAAGTMVSIRYTQCSKQIASYFF